MLSVRCQLPSMSNLTAANRAHLLGRNRDHRRRLSGERYELDLVSFTPRVNVHCRSDIAGLEPFAMEGRGQYHSVVFANHKTNILERVRCDQPGEVSARVHNPDGPDER